MPKSVLKAPNIPMKAELLQSSDFNNFFSRKWVEYLTSYVPGFS